MIEKMLKGAISRMKCKELKPTDKVIKIKIKICSIINKHKHKHAYSIS